MRSSRCPPDRLAGSSRPDAVDLRPRAVRAPCGRTPCRSRSTWSWVIFSSSFSARSSSSARDVAVLLGGLEVLAGVAADVADGDAPVLGHVLDDLHVLLARSSVSGGKLRRITTPSLFGLTRRGRCRGSPSRWRQSEPRSWGLTTSCAGLGHLERGELLQRNLRAVVVDEQLLDQRRRRPDRCARWRTAFCTCSTALSILSMASSRVSSVTTDSVPTLRQGTAPGLEACSAGRQVLGTDRADGSR